MACDVSGLCARACVLQRQSINTDATRNGERRAERKINLMYDAYPLWSGQLTSVISYVVLCSNYYCFSIVPPCHCASQTFSHIIMSVRVKHLYSDAIIMQYYTTPCNDLDSSNTDFKPKVDCAEKRSSNLIILGFCRLGYFKMHTCRASR